MDMNSPNAYAEVSVIVDGALEESETFYDETMLSSYIGEIEEEAPEHGYPVEVYVIYHDHSPELECECVQYLTDHRPYASFNQS